MSEETPDATAEAGSEATTPAPLALNEDRRQSRRVLLRVHAQVALPDNKRLEGRTFDISEGGLGLISDYSLNQGITVTLAFTLLDKNGQPRRMTTSAQVANCIFSAQAGGFRLGLIFKQPSPEFKATLAGFLASH